MNRIIKKIEIVRGYFSVPLTAASKVKLGCMYLFSPLTRSLYRNGFYIWFLIDGKIIHVFVNGWEGMEMIYEIFVEEVYKVSADPRNTFRIIDVGSNMGFSILYFLWKYPLGEIIGCEPDPNNYKRLQAVAEQLARVRVYQYAVSDTTGKVMFHIMKRGTVGSSMRKRESTASTITVHAMTLSGLMDLFGWRTADILKFDVEGAECKMFKGVDTRCFRYITGEIHPDLLSPDELKKLESMFAGYARAPLSKGRYLIR